MQQQSTKYHWSATIWLLEMIKTYILEQLAENFPHQINEKCASEDEF